MSQRLNVRLVGGAGQIIMTPEPPDSGLYNQGDIVTVLCVPDGGYTFINWTIGSTEIGTTVEIEIEIGRSDISLVGNLSGNTAPEYEYGLRLVSEYCGSTGTTRITVEDKNYTGAVLKVDIADVQYSIGDFDSDPSEMFVTSSLEWAYWIKDGLPDLRFLLTLDPRRFRVTYYRNYFVDPENPDIITYDYIWIGYLKSNFMTRPLYRSNYKMNFVASDGLSDLDGYRVTVPAVDMTNCMTILAHLLNGTFKEGLPIRECVRVFERSMDRGTGDSLLTQFTINADALYTNEDIFQEEGSVITYNPGKTYLAALKTVLSFLIARVFQYNGYWYIVRILEYAKLNINLIEYSPVGILTNQEYVPNNQEFECISNLVETGVNGYSEFNAVLNLGSINKPEERQIIYDDFSAPSWYNPNPGRPSTNPTPGNKLKRWDYINAVVFDGVLDSETARIQRVSNPTSGQLGEFVRIWCTAAGANDPLMSGFTYRSDLGSTAVKNAQLISIQAKFQVLRRGSADTSVPPANSHFAALRVQIGNKFLTYDGDTTFSWSTNTNDLCLFPVTNAGVFNIIDIRDVEVPEDGEVFIVLWQLITMTGTRHRYIIDWEDVVVNLSRNDALTYKAVEAKSLTNSSYSNVFPKHETFIGDAYTNLSSSAIILINEPNKPVSEVWCREERPGEKQKLLGLVLQDLVNIYAKNNFTYVANILESEDGPLSFVKGIDYKGSKNILIAAKLDDFSGMWEFQFYKLLNKIGIATILINWQLLELDIAAEVYIDANMRIYEDEILRIEQYSNATGAFTVEVGKRMRINYFYLANLYYGSPANPRLQLFINEVLVDSHPIVLTETCSFDYSFTIQETLYSIIVAAVE